MRAIFTLLVLVSFVFGLDEFENSLTKGIAIVTKVANSEIYDPNLYEEFEEILSQIKDGDTKKALIQTLKISSLTPLKLQKEYFNSAIISFREKKVQRSAEFEAILKDGANAFEDELKASIPKEIAKRYEIMAKSLDKQLISVAKGRQSREIGGKIYRVDLGYFIQMSTKFTNQFDNLKKFFYKLENG